MGFNKDYSRLEVETAGTLVNNTAMVDLGGHNKFSTAAGHMFSMYKKKAANGDITTRAPVVYIDGVAKGGKVIVAASASDNVIDVELVNTCYIAGNKITSLAATTDLTCARGSGSGFIKYSICVNYNSGSPTYVATAGSEGSEFSTVRGATGGPPLILSDHIELGQVWYDSVTDAAVTGDEIHQSANVERDSSVYPSAVINPLNGTVTFDQVLPLSHVGPATKKVFLYSYYTPTFAKLPDVEAVDVPGLSDSVTETKLIGGTVDLSSTTSSSGGTFTMLYYGKGAEMGNSISGSQAYMRYIPDESDMTEFEMGLCAIRTKTDTSGDIHKKTGTMTPLGDWLNAVDVDGVIV